MKCPMKLQTTLYSSNGSGEVLNSNYKFVISILTITLFDPTDRSDQSLIPIVKGV